MMKRLGSISVDEAARMYGVSASTISREVADGRLAKIMIRGAARITLESLERWQRAMECEADKKVIHDQFTNSFF